MRITLIKFFMAFMVAISFFCGPALSSAIAAVPEARSGGKFFESKGTKSSEDYKGLAERPVFEYGKGLQFGNLHVTPSIDYKYVWDNNVFLEESGRRSDYYNRITPEVSAEYPLNGGQHVLNAFASSVIERFNRFAFQDHEDFTFGGGVQLNFVPFYIGVDGAFTNTTETGDTEFTDRVERDEAAIHALLEIPFASFFLETEPFYYDIDYDTLANSTFDREDATIFQRIGVDLSPRTQVLAEYGFSDISYGSIDGRDGNVNQGMAGLRGYLTERIVYQAWGGYQARVYDVAERPDYYGFIARTALTFNMSETSALTLKGDRNPQESTFDNQSFYVRNRVELAWSKQLAERLFFKTREILSYNEYSRVTSTALSGSGGGETRRDYVWETGVGLEYRFPNDLVSLFGEYRYRARDTNTGSLGYDGQTVSLGAKATF